MAFENAFRSARVVPHIVVSTAVVLCAAPVAAQTAKPFDFSIKNIMRGPELYGRQPTNVRWSADSRWIYFTWLEPGTDWRETPKQFRVRAIPGAKPERVSIPARREREIASGFRANRYRARAR